MNIDYIRNVLVVPKQRNSTGVNFIPKYVLYTVLQIVILIILGFSKKCFNPRKTFRFPIQGEWWNTKRYVTTWLQNVKFSKITNFFLLTIQWIVEWQHEKITRQNSNIIPHQMTFQTLHVWYSRTVDNLVYSKRKWVKYKRYFDFVFKKT